MKSIKSDKKAEDILTDDLLLNQMDQRDSDTKQRPDFQYLLAKNIRNAVRAGKGNFDPAEKLELNQRLQTSIEQAVPKRTLFRFWSVAGVFLVIFVLAFLLKSLNDSKIRRFAIAESTTYGSDHTTLVLHQQKEIEIISPESKIAYSANGAIINIDAQGNSKQTVAQDGTVYNTLVVPYGKRSRLQLPDHTIVWLNSGSKLTYPVKFNADKREVFLQGEALFDVSHNKDVPFYVLTRKMDVKVLGTNFNLSAYDDDSLVSTVLVRGSVELEYRKKLLGLTSVEKMVPGMLAVFDPENNTVVQSKVDPRNFTSWKDGYLILENGSLESIVKRLSRYYNVTIEFEDPQLEQETFSGFLDLRNSAVEVLKIISEITDTDVQKDGAVIRIKEKKNS